MFVKIEIQTRSKVDLIDITAQVQRAVTSESVDEGVCFVYCPHTTAGITINENADPSVVRDILYETEKIIPFRDNYQHMEGNSAAHIKSSLFGPSLNIIVTGGRLVLGTWQSIYFCEFDGPRHRHLFVKVMEG